MNEHPLDTAIISLTSCHRAALDTGFSFPGYLRDNLEAATNTLYAFRRTQSFGNERHLTFEALQLMLEASGILSDHGDPDAFAAKVLAAELILHPLAGWPENVAGKTWTSEGVTR